MGLRVEPAMTRKNYWTFHATKLDGTPHDTKGRETQIFERSADGSWRLVYIHYSAAGSR